MSTAEFEIGFQSGVGTALGFLGIIWLAYFVVRSLIDWGLDLAERRRYARLLSEWEAAREHS